MTREKGIETLASGLSRVNPARLPGWSPRDNTVQSVAFLCSKSLFSYSLIQITVLQTPFFVLYFSFEKAERETKFRAKSIVFNIQILMCIHVWNGVQ